MTFTTLASTASMYVIDAESSKPIEVYWSKTVPWADDGVGWDDWTGLAGARADYLNAHPDELHVDLIRQDPVVGPVLLERVVVAHGDDRTGADRRNLPGAHTMADCEYGIPQR